jgi:plastocyanin
MNKLGILLLALGWATARAATVPVSIVNYTYIADTAVVTQGDSVVWTNNGTSPHTTTSGAGGIPDSIWNSGTLSPGQSYGRTFNQAGDFPYYCAIHYPINRMAGLIRVQSAGIEQGGRKEETKGGTLALTVQPNPFSDRVSVGFQQAASGRASLAVYSSPGRLVRTIFSGYSETGERTASWDGRDESGAESSAGVYLVRLETGTGVAVLRLVKLD